MGGNRHRIPKNDHEVHTRRPQSRDRLDRMLRRRFHHMEAGPSSMTGHRRARARDDPYCARIPRPQSPCSTATKRSPGSPPNRQLGQWREQPSQRLGQLRAAPRPAPPIPLASRQGRLRSSRKPRRSTRQRKTNRQPWMSPIRSRRHSGCSPNRNDSHRFQAISDLSETHRCASFRSHVRATAARLTER